MTVYQQKRIGGAHGENKPIRKPSFSKFQVQYVDAKPYILAKTAAGGWVCAYCLTLVEVRATVQTLPSSPHNPVWNVTHAWALPQGMPFLSTWITLCVCVEGCGVSLHFYQDVCSSCPLACQRERRSGDTGVSAVYWGVWSRRVYSHSPFARPGPAAPPWRTSTSTTPTRRRSWRTATPRRSI